VDGLGGASDLKVLLKAVELVDGAMAAPARDALRGKPLPVSGIRIRYGEQEIGVVPVRIELTPQDWLRFAKNPANAKWQAQALERALGMNPDDTALRKTLAEQYLEAGKIDLAIAQYRAVLARKQDDMTALSGLSRCYVEKKDYARALPLTRRITELNPKDAGAHAISGFLYGKMGKWGEAVRHYETSLKLKPDDPMVLFSQGGVYERAGKARPSRSRSTRLGHTSGSQRPGGSPRGALSAGRLPEGAARTEAAKLYATPCPTNTKETPMHTQPLPRSTTRKMGRSRRDRELQKAIAVQAQRPHFSTITLGSRLRTRPSATGGARGVRKGPSTKPDDLCGACPHLGAQLRATLQGSVEALNRVKKTAPRTNAGYAESRVRPRD
jgi:tetratricopeptide (TPR) repeat protein